MSSPTTVAKGNTNLVYGVGRSRGARWDSNNNPSPHYVPLPIIQNLTITPKYAVESIGEFGTPNDILTIQSYSNVEVGFKIYETDIIYLYAMIMDVDPALTSFSVFPEMLYKNPFTLFGNQVSMLAPGNIINGFVCTQILLSDSSSSQDVHGNKMIDFKGTGTIFRQVLNGAVDYTRGNFASVSFPTPYGKTFSAVALILTTYTAVSQPLPGVNAGATSAQNYLAVLQNGVPVNSGFTQTGTSFVVAAGTTGASDWWDVFTPVAAHVPYSTSAT